MKILYGGLTQAHNLLIKGAMESLGYEVEPLPTPDNEALRIGKEYCNKGQCNPVYYTVGNLVKHLLKKAQREEDIEKRYIFVTVGSCGPCRFGMYEMEYRKALKEAGFPSFKVVTFEQSSALLEELGREGLKFDRRFFLSLLRAVILGDLINDLYYKTKPYEVEKNAADRWKEDSLELLYLALKKGKSIPQALREVRKKLSLVEVDYFQPKPKVKIIGEFFAQTTEGDGNYKMAAWLIEEGAQPVIEPVTSWVDYLIYEKLLTLKERIHKNPLKTLRELFLVKALGVYIKGLYNYYRFWLGNQPSPLADQKLIARLAAPYYNPLLVGGEGHMEVGKHIYAIRYKKAHMVLSIKPFGCMPSTQSDGVQSKVAEQLRSIFLSVETSGDAQANVKSRVLMALHEARIKALNEYEQAKRELNIGEKDIERSIKTNPKLKRADLPLPSRYISTAANALLWLR